MKPGRIQYVDTGRSFGGAERITCSLATAFACGGSEVECVIDPSADRFAEALSGAGITIRRIPEVDRLSMVGLLAREVERFRPDVMHIHRTWPLSDRYAALAGRVKGARRVVTTEHIRFEECGLRDRVSKRFLSCLDHRIVGVSQAVRRSLLQYWGINESRVKVIRNGIDLDQFRGGNGEAIQREWYPENCEYRIGAVGRLEEQKNFALLLEAMPAVLQAIPGTALLIVGEGSLRADLESLVSRLGIETAVRFAGSVPDIAPFLAAFDLFVLPSLWEGLPLTVLEAMAAGTPVVATAVEGTMEAVRDGEEGLIVPVGDSGALAAACIQIFREQRETRRMVEAALRTVQSRYSIERMIEGYREVYEG